MKSSSETHSPGIDALQESLWQGLQGMGTLRKAAAGTVLFREGEPVRGIFLLARGTVRLSLGKNGKSIVYRIARPQYILGLPATLLGPRAGGPAYRIVGRRRLGRLVELVGDPPVEAPAGAWPGGG